MALVAKLATYHDTDDRRETRSRLWLNVPTGMSDAAVTTVTIHDLSRSGLLIQAEADLPVGSALSIEIPHAGSVDATIVWASGSSFGCQFNAPISDAALSAALAESRVVYPDFPLPVERPPLAPARNEAIEPAPSAEVETDRGSLSTSARILTVIGISLLLWLGIVWAVLSLF